MADLGELLARASGVHAKIVADVPQLRRGMVWCTVCGHSEHVDSANALRDGWPKHCGYTMSIDSQEERHAIAQQKQVTGFGLWMADFRWAMNAMRARRFRREISFSKRIRFDAALRPRVDYPNVIAYPDAVYHITVDDLIRAMEATVQP